MMASARGVAPELKGCDTVIGGLDSVSTKDDLDRFCRSHPYAEMSETNCPFRFRAREALAMRNVQRSLRIARRNANKLLAGAVISIPSDTRD